MEKYLIPLVPGPVAVPQEILKVAATNFGSADFEPEYLALYKDTEKLLQKMMETRNRVVIQTGEGMLVLWTALKSTLKPGDRVLVLSTGLFGEGFGDMAKALGQAVFAALQSARPVVSISMPSTVPWMGLRVKATPSASRSPWISRMTAEALRRNT